MDTKDKFADEMLTDEQLDAVAGGKAAECANDSRFLNSLNGSTDRYGEERIMWSAGAFSEEIEAGWATVGIKADVHFACGGFGRANKYWRMDTGESLTQEQARQYAMEKTGHYMTEADWKW